MRHVNDSHVKKKKKKNILKGKKQWGTMFRERIRRWLNIQDDDEGEQCRDKKQFEKKIKQAKRSMRSIGAPPEFICGWEYNIRKGHAMQGVARARADMEKFKIVLVQETQRTPVVSHIALGKKYQMIDEESIVVSDPQKDWIDTKKQPKTESNPEGKDDAKETE